MEKLIRCGLGTLIGSSRLIGTHICISAQLFYILIPNHKIISTPAFLPSAGEQRRRLRRQRQLISSHLFFSVIIEGCVFTYRYPAGGISKFLQIFLMNPNFLLVHRKRYLEGMDNGQKTPHGHPDFNSYVKIQCVFVDNGRRN